MWAFFVNTHINISMLESLEKITKTVKDFSNHNQFTTWLQEVGKSQLQYSRSICTEDNYVSGCTSNVWITGKEEESKWQFEFYSSTMFTNGIVYILCETCNGLTTEEINKVNFSDFDPIALHVTLNKKKGLQAMINHVKDIVKS